MDGESRDKTHRLGNDAAIALQQIRLVVLDVDGVLTDGRLHYGAEGETNKVFHVRDGVGIKAVLRAGLQVAVISGRNSPAVSARCRELGIAHVYQGCDDKVSAFNRLLLSSGVNASAALCIVDDTTDLELVYATGYSVAVADAHPKVRAAATRLTTLAGGHGAVREVCDWLLTARDS
jgi:3-deoxy-D-manno-octulosonate 8-phosphate phosphatase (KDO 8-P phosphatase)